MEPEKELSAQVDRLIEATNRLGSVNSTSGIHIHSGGMTAIVVAVMGIGSILYGMHLQSVGQIERDADTKIRAAELRVLAAERRADMEQIETIRAQLADHTDDLKGIRAWLKINGENLAKLEAKNAN